jgi:acyl carrier protein
MHSDSDLPGVPVAGIRQTIGDITKAVLERDIDQAVDMFDQGATSLAFIRIVAEVNERYDITFDVAELEEASVNEMSALVAQQLNSQQPVKARD